jgi:hypothetical protein
MDPQIAQLIADRGPRFELERSARDEWELRRDDLEREELERDGLDREQGTAMTSSHDELMTLEEVCAFLRMSKQTAYKQRSMGLVRTGVSPGKVVDFPAQ